MKNRIFPVIHILFLLLFTSGHSSGQTEGADTLYYPVAGQPGKDVIWLPTPMPLVRKMLDIADVGHGDYLIDLGSGDGRTVIAAARLGARALGIEYNPEMVAFSRMKAEEAGLSGRTRFIQADLFECDLSEATVITLFLLPEINLRLRPKLLALKPGTRIVSNTFTMGEWDPDYEVTCDSTWGTWYAALMWIVPANIDGKWIAGDSELDIHQKFQMFYGTIKTPAETYIINEGRIYGDSLTFKAGPGIYSLRAGDNGQLSGSERINTSMTSWKAIRKTN